MSLQSISYCDFATIVKAITGNEIDTMLRASGSDRILHALEVPHSGIGEVAYYPTMHEKAAALSYQIICGHPLLDGNKRTGYICMLEFLYRNHCDWQRPDRDGELRAETVHTIESVASGTISLREFTEWVRKHCTV